MRGGLAGTINIIAPKVLISLIGLLVCYPILGRSLWLDEVMLFSNFPLQSIMQVFQPLPFYDQATIPSYGLIMSVIGAVPSEMIRGGSVFLITFMFLLVLLRDDKSWWKHFFAFAVLVSFRSCFVMMSELKHYSLESVGVLIALVWFVNKDERDTLNVRDVGVLFAGLICGIVTVVMVPLSVCLYLAIKIYRKSEIRNRERLIALGVLVLTGLYYALVRHVSIIQIANYSWVYQSHGAVENVKVFVSSAKSLLGMLVGLLTVASFISLVYPEKNDRAYKVAIISICALFVALMLSALGVYPARNYRHITWVYSICTLIIITAINNVSTRNVGVKIVRLMVIIGVLVLGIQNGRRFWKDSYEGTENRASIEYLCSKPKAAIGVWGGGQPAIQYYSKAYPEIKKHNYFGVINSNSFLDTSKFDGKGAALNYEKSRSLLGAWGRACRYTLANNYDLMGRSLIAEAPKDSLVYIFASHYSMREADAYDRAQVSAIHKAIEAAHCQVEVDKEFRLAIVYSLRCPSGSF